MAERLYNPRIEVTLDDGEVLVVQTHNADLVRWDRTAAKHGWPGFQAAPFLWVTFLAWSALRREGKIPNDLAFDTFSESRAVSVRNLTNPDGTDEVDTIDPFRQGVAPG